MASGLWLGFLIGVPVGALFGFFIAAFIMVARDADRALARARDTAKGGSKAEMLIAVAMVLALAAIGIPWAVRQPATAPGPPTSIAALPGWHRPAPVSPRTADGPAVASTAPQPAWVAVLNAAGRKRGLDWRVYDFPLQTLHHNWAAVAYPKGEWKPWCKEDGGTDQWYTDGHSSPRAAAQALLRMLGRPPNQPAEYCDQAGAWERHQEKIDRFRDKREWRGN